jgi:DNA-binding MarR family transcriptional regulator
MGHAIPERTIDAWARLQRASQGLLSAVESDLKAAGHPPLAWYDVLLELKRAEKGGLRPRALQSQMLLAQYNLSRLLDRMEREGCVERRLCPDDGRGQIVVITPKGRQLVKRMWPAYEAAIQRHFAERLSAEDAARLARLLGKLLPR